MMERIIIVFSKNKRFMVVTGTMIHCWQSVSVEYEAHALQNPVTCMLVTLDISHEYHSFTHRILSVLGYIDRSLEGVAKLQFVGFHRDDLD
jgi:hypothetical protein